MVKNGQQDQKKLKILVAVLDWGLGHATRCIPIISMLLDKGLEPILLSGKDQSRLLQEEFPSCRVVLFPDTGIRYGKTRTSTLMYLLYRLPGFFAIIRKEKRWLEDFILRERIDGIISDNRYGFYESSLFTVFMTHQLRIRLPGFRLGEDFLMRMHLSRIRRFSRCWVPDISSKQGLSGVLGHPALDGNGQIRYIGPLTRLKKLPLEPDKGSLLILLSGPEPQRTILESIMMDVLLTYPGRKVLVRGLPITQESPLEAPGFEIYNHLTGAALSPFFCRADLVIARSGYSTVMDVLCMEKKSLLIPTPGQTEQEYLARYLHTKNLIYAVSQKSFGLDSCKEALEHFPYQFISLQDNSLLEAALEESIREWSQSRPSQT